MIETPAIPEGLCGVGGCVFTPHDGTHSWELLVSPPKGHLA